MQSLKELFKIGNGPSSSHTMGPKRATEKFREKHPDADFFKVVLFGSLALTGKGHLTDYIIKKALSGIKCEIVFDTEYKCKVHPNTFDIFAYKNGKLLEKWRVYSVGGGSFRVDGEPETLAKDVYKQKNFKEIRKFCDKNNMDLFDYVCSVEGESEITEFLSEIWTAMQNSIVRGLNTEGIIPGKLKLKRKAKEVFEKKLPFKIDETEKVRLISSYAYAVGEENACGGVIVTAPTCGSCGVVPASLYFMKQKYNIPDEKIIKALAVAGVIGNVVKTNASISGAECGCQAEIGTACSMAAGAIAYLLGLDLERIDNSAEVAMEHHLGLTCDPVYGYVQIPCIERNAVAAVRAVDAAILSSMLKEDSLVTFDMVVDTMYETGKDLSTHYRETSEGGLAKKYCNNKFNYKIK